MQSGISSKEKQKYCLSKTKPKKTKRKKGKNLDTIFKNYIPLVFLIFLKRCLVFPILLFSSISLHWSLRKAFLFKFKWVYSYSNSNGYIFPFLLCFLLLFFSQPFVRPPQTAIFFFFSFLFLGDGLDSCLLYKCHELIPIIHQALCLLDLAP